ncbi:MAG: hypothetical protein B6D58_05355 [candidate division Zixibacteria bacterium 4484_95]|nr:MAG: hypothetical protein B6D58_05355 [candidate division Zixibacteria bacterium 4484_95]
MRGFWFKISSFWVILVQTIFNNCPVDNKLNSSQLLSISYRSKNLTQLHLSYVLMDINISSGLLFLLSVIYQNLTKEG